MGYENQEVEAHCEDCDNYDRYEGWCTAIEEHVEHDAITCLYYEWEVADEKN